MGRPRVHGERVQIGLRVDEDMVRRIEDELAERRKQDRQSQNDLIVKAVDEYLTRAEARRRPKPISRNWKD